MRDAILNNTNEIVNVDNIIFDFGGVLMKHNLMACRSAFRELMSDNAIYSKLGIGNENPQGTLVDAFNRGMTTEDFLQEVLKLCRPCTTEGEIIYAWNLLHDEVLDETWEQIKDLRAKGYRTYLFSNTNQIHWMDTEMKYAKHVEECFDDIFLSFEMHCAKPDKRAFMEVNRSVGADPKRTIFVDDTTANREAAEAFVQWRTCWDMKSLLSTID